METHVIVDEDKPITVGGKAQAATCPSLVSARHHTLNITAAANSHLVADVHSHTGRNVDDEPSHQVVRNKHS